MSNILKKITKKYKWLRFLNKKVTKLSILGTSLVGLCISSGASFAKYIDTNYGNGNAGAARFKVSVTNDTRFIYLPDDLSTFKMGYYAFVAEFCVDFSECEVKSKYDLYLKICGEYSTNYDSPLAGGTQTYFLLPSNIDYMYTIEGGVLDDKHTFVEDDVAYKLTNNYEVFTSNKVYYGFSDNGTEYNWYPSFNMSSSSKEVIIKDINANALDKHYFRFVYFTYIAINASSEGNNSDVTYSATFENSIILSKLLVEQVV